MQGIFLDDVLCRDPRVVGAKAAVLASLRPRFLIPNGFVLSTSVTSGLLASAEAPLRKWSDALSVQQRQELDRLVQQLGSTRLAVRSSGTAEDSAGLSYAGQYHTELNVTPGEVPDAVGRCLLSLLGDRAAAYERLSGTDSASSHMAVMVQTMVNARTAGVMFTVDPVSGDPDRIVVEAVPGLGDSLVSGETIPDRFIFSKQGSFILEYALANGSYGSLPGSVEGGLAKLGCVTLSEDQVALLSAQGQQIAQYLRAPQDIEWAIDFAGEIKILQSRPITAVGVFRDTYSGSEPFLF